MIRTSGNFDTGELKIVVNDKNILDIRLRELNQDSPEFQNGLLGKLVNAVEEARKAGYAEAKNDMLNCLESCG